MSRAPARRAGGARQPAEVCARLLEALDASEGRRRRRMRDTRPDAIGLAIKRDLLTRAAREAPSAAGFEGWLLAESLKAGSAPSGARYAMALEILADWRLAQRSGSFGRWLDAGAPSEDKERSSAGFAGATEALAGRSGTRAKPSADGA